MEENKAAGVCRGKGRRQEKALGQGRGGPTQEPRGQCGHVGGSRGHLRRGEQPKLGVETGNSNLRRREVTVTHTDPT